MLPRADNAVSEPGPGKRRLLSGRSIANQLKEAAVLNAFLQEQEGAQVVEYALIIAIVSIALVLALDAVRIAGSFSNFIGRVASCITTTTCT